MPRLFSALFVSCCLASTALPAQADEHTVIVKPSDSGKGCVEVELQGKREQSISCLNEKLQPPANTTDRRPPTLSGAEETIQRPSNQLGLYNRAALEHRMGNAFGKSLVPQRPSTPPPASPLVPAH